MINFWQDFWAEDNNLKTAFPRLYSLAVNKDIKLSALNKKWSFGRRNLRRRPLRGWEIEEEKRLDKVDEITQLNNSKDSLLWLGIMFS